MQPTIDKLLKMMKFLNVEYYDIPSHSMPLPEEASGKNFRLEKKFKLLRDGSMTYHGFGVGAKYPETHYYGLKLSDRWIERAYVYLINDVRKKVIKKYPAKIAHVILKFNDLDFVDLIEYEEESK